ncbi:proton phosphate symporter [Chlorella sorokiniana]|uniref:Proton phosphate symporter n=1 Tax=Chlorella sorokiniana TaxID=3076 RepID=A0A2P6TXJ9_CHLSO|nr:proton phosphate symporter [Chlorella sorokiniana]|eukprot:PRW58781.1 proton phosphate symporter [Chlorella sorokiniana]
MFVEAWMVFAIGNIKPFLALDMPHCFGGVQPYSCSQSAADAVTYVEVCGIILGMLALGFFADVIGRKWGSRLASSVMLLGGILLTSCAGSDSTFLAMFLVSLFVLGMGVGGEYPVASSSAAERAEGSKAMRQRRGETVVLTFSQQGWGNLSNTLCIILLLAMQGATGAEVTPKQAEITWRVQFGVGTAVCLGLTAFRWTLLQESKVWSAERHDVAEHLPHKGLRTASRRHYLLLLRHFWPRLLVTSTAWMLNDFAFYGHKLFQSNFIAIVIGEATNFKRKLYTLLNSGIALIGYYAAAALIDRRWYGRVRMQAAGFAMLFILFLLCAALYDTLTQHTAAFQVLYYLASFFNQFGPNCTTWLVAGEVYPTGVRSFFHGMSAAAGKVGALVAAAAFSHISARAAFYASSAAGLAGFILTALFLPDTTGLDLHEIDRMNRYLLEGHLRNYHGEAVNPRYLSLFERWRNYDEHYNPERDYAHKQLQLHPHLAEATASLASLASAGKEDFNVHEPLLAALARKLGIRGGGDGGGPAIPADAVRVVRKSFDARNVQRSGEATGKAWVYLVDVESSALKAAGLRRLQEHLGVLERQQQQPGPEQAPAAAAAAPAGGAQRSGAAAEPVVVVGCGPAGLFAALELAQAGIKVVLLDRGQPVEVRGKDIGALFVRRHVNPESNLCYGEGGAGTWSDGKLTTRIGRNSDPVRHVLSTLYRFGAPESVLVSGKPHLGTDRLVRILKAFREYLISLGCEVRFGTRVDDILVKGGRVAGVQLSDGSTIAAARVVLAVGHSARELYRTLLHQEVAITPKPFAVGFRIEHPQELINQLQYGAEDAAHVLRGKGPYPVAEYRLAAEISAAAAAQAAAAVGGGDGSGWLADDWYQPLLASRTEGAAAPSGGSSSSSGQIVPTSTSEEELCINGMSFSRRDSKWANSALVVTVQPADWEHLLPEHGPLAGMALQQEFEREAARRGGGGFVAPAQRVADFLAGQAPRQPLPSSSYRLGLRPDPLHNFYPPHMTAAFVAALARFERQMPGFASSADALLHAAETRTSAPLRIDRTAEGLESLTLPGLYPCGEGAGYAGGIVSSAVDGLRVGSTIAAELTGAARGLDPAAFKVKGGY